MKHQAPLFDAPTLKLNTKNAIGMGNRRWVFQHPYHPHLCIKVSRKAHIRQQLDSKGDL